MGHHPDFLYCMAQWRLAALRQEAAAHRLWAASTVPAAKPVRPREWARRFVAMLMSWRPGAALVPEP